MDKIQLKAPDFSAQVTRRIMAEVFEFINAQEAGVIMRIDAVEVRKDLADRVEAILRGSLEYHDLVLEKLRESVTVLLNHLPTRVMTGKPVDVDAICDERMRPLRERLSRALNPTVIVEERHEWTGQSWAHFRRLSVAKIERLDDGILRVEVRK
jgi:hypothetical protein